MLLEPFERKLKPRKRLPKRQFKVKKIIIIKINKTIEE